MARKSKKEVINEIEAWKEDHWENIRRNEEYKRKYQEYKNFLKKRGSKDRFPRTKAIAIGLEIAEKFGLVTPIDPSLPYSENLSEEIRAKGFLIFPLHPHFYHPIKKSSFIVSDSKNYSPGNRAGAGQGFAPNRRKGTRKECLFDGRFLGLLIDPSLPLKQIFILVEQAVKSAKEGLSDWESWFRGERKRFEDNKKSREIYDDRQKGLSIKKLAKKYFPNDTDSGPKRVKAFLAKAKKLIGSSPEN